MSSFVYNLGSYEPPSFSEHIEADNIMDYSNYQYAFFDYQLEIIKKLNNEFNHI
ncbi:hypothetical protein [Capnocytophaga canimorsus]|uniref:Uncharacterized protein n=1 Tax=Capnocytophaga canimorsus TaxID=28188 RepID=A0A0B7IJC3_9FLAO|nr:hypothetical protein [Capnocytophaga canimorsus]CEN48618.1 hypothetical protein CCAN2_1920052 [Capnocytophaga canimorsus]CEN50068.1 hypothetical protein CCAN11_2070013 [Capnocytophaga canimorsus]VEJ19408.1 Uncharacterised protein [Capnocytophaga canimorsus]